ncbi:hypothetical protein FIM02_02650 [SAR202 cluster bacterium AD-802-E10_MRT_200m]|nr:hypothetical protein [SAR202 cluster bacterium AD-802-E10_MRT_200m]
MNLKPVISLSILVFIVLGSSCNSNANDLHSDLKSNSMKKHYSGFLLATDFTIGVNRFPFAVLSADGLSLKAPEIKARFFAANDGQLEFLQESIAKQLTISNTTSHQHLDGTIHLHQNNRIFYVIDSIVFDYPGITVAEFSSGDEVQSPVSIQSLAFEISARSKAPQVGDRIPPWIMSIPETPSEGVKLQALESPLNQVTLDEAAHSSKPFVIVFSSPMFCTSQMCGPVLDIVSTVSKQFNTELDFLHIEPYDLTIAQTEGRLVRTGIFDEWELPSEPWVFIIDSDNRIVDRYEGLFTQKELEASILNLIAS